ncbi:kinesin-like protein KIF20B isoform X2 [Nelusetta ayraudi]|uniref:kinesin-like protein KIF20B isoform X2 n=1 Tax=Nelusetta ayraudi TaxID=303726 RepID=UPI003F701A8D
MMESCLAGKPERTGPVEVEDIRRDLLGEFSSLPAQDSVVSQSENLRVYLRVRPFTSAESNNGESQDCVTIEGLDTVILRAPRSCQSNRQSEKSLPQTGQRFSFTQVFGPDASQRKVFEGSVRGMVQDVLEGGNCLLFTYGVTNAGKTFTFLGPESDSGLLPRSLAVIFNSISGHLYGRSDLKPQRCRDYSRLTPEQQVAESNSKKNLLKTIKESDKSIRSTFLDASSLSSDSSVNSVSEMDSFCLDVASNVRFSVWVSFCEIYNENIHDLLEQVSGGHHKRTVLRLSQDVKGNSFIKDLHWVQVNSFEEAYRVMKIGKKNQSLSATRLNQLSSRSHSIFSVRILRVLDAGVPRVLDISELALCDLAGSERCSRTHNTGERLKEAGNINSSLLTLGKCISAMKLNQHAKFQHHIPFRESKLTHFLQFFFCGAGRVSMVVNINQNSSSFDETLNVLKFSALAQKVVMLNSRQTMLDTAPQRAALELSMIIDGAEQRRNVTASSRKSSMVAWETTLEDVMEDEDEDEDEEYEQECTMDGTVLEAEVEEEDMEDKDKTMEEEKMTEKASALRLVLEAQIREEVCTEFMELFHKMERDYNERLEKEREILEERAEKRLDILKNLVSRTVDLSALNTNSKKEDQATALEGIISSLTEELEKIREDAHSVQSCLTEYAPAAELDALRLEKQVSQDQLQEAKQSLELQQQKVSDLLEMCLQKDDIINKLQAAMDATVEEATRDRALVESSRSELLQLQEKCCCLSKSNDEEEEEPAKKRAIVEEEIWRLHDESEKKDAVIAELREAGERSRFLEEELRRREEEVEQLNKDRVSLEEKVQELTAADSCPNCDSFFSSLESERRESSRLMKENKALVNGMFQLQKEVSGLMVQLQDETNRSGCLSEERTATISVLKKQVDHLKEEVKEEDGEGSPVVEELKKKSQLALESSAKKSQQIQDLQSEKSQLEEFLTASQNCCTKLREELANQSKDSLHQRGALEAEGRALRGRLEEMQRERDELQGAAGQKANLLEEARAHVETLRRELERLKVELQSRDEKEEDEDEEDEEEGDQENRQEEEQRKLTVVEELKEELQQFHKRRRDEEETHQSRAFAAVRREIERQERGSEAAPQRCGRRVRLPEQDVCVSPLTSNAANKKKSPKTTGRKRKSCEVEGLLFSESKKHRLRENKQSSSVAKAKADRALQKVGELIQSSPSILSSKAKSIMGRSGGRAAAAETMTVPATKVRRGRKKLYKATVSSPLLDSPDPVFAGPLEEKESDHLIIKRQLRSKTCRK